MIKSLLMISLYFGTTIYGLDYFGNTFFGGFVTCITSFFMVFLVESLHNLFK